MFIVYEEDDGKMAVIIPLDTSIPLNEIARKDVPPGKDFWIINDSDLPEDQTFRDAWELDKGALGPAHGQGIGADAWFAEKAND